MPPTLTSLVRPGSAIESGTDGIAARWKTKVAPCTARSTACGSAIEPSISEKLGNSASSAAFSRLPLEKSSRPTTWWPCRSSASERCPPMKPAAPVTQTFAMMPPSSSRPKIGTPGAQGEVSTSPQAALPSAVFNLLQQAARADVVF